MVYMYQNVHALCSTNLKCTKVGLKCANPVIKMYFITSYPVIILVVKKGGNHAIKLIVDGPTNISMTTPSNSTHRGHRRKAQREHVCEVGGAEVEGTRSRLQLQNAYIL